MNLDNEYYEDKTLSVSSVRLFAQNPKRALANYLGEFPWFDDNNALLQGRYFHDLLEFSMEYINNEENVKLTKEKDSSIWVDNLLEKAKQYAFDKIKPLEENEYSDLFSSKGKTKGQLKATNKPILEWFNVVINSDPVKEIIMQTMISQVTNQERFEVLIEEPFKSSYDNVEYKGKLDIYVVDKQEKVIHAYDYKTAKSYDPSGWAWGDDIFGKHRFMPVEWTVEKLFPWQAGVYRQLLLDNGYHDYTIDYHYIVVTKEKTPRLDIFTIDDQSMDIGYKQFCKWLVKANNYINGIEEAPLIADGSAYYNTLTQKEGNKLVSHPEEGWGQDQEYAEDESEELTGMLEKLS